MKSIARSILAKLNLLEPVQRLSWHVRRRFWHVDRKLANAYLNEKNERKRLHIGCGGNVLPGWLNSDYYPRSPSILYIDATEQFPFGDGIFDYIFSEHMIEHVPLTDGFSMLRECHRVLRKGGRIRISTPDLRFVVSLYTDEPSELQKQYINWSTKEFANWAPYPDARYVVNNFVRDWGHQFIYDEETLRFAMQKAGFADVIRCKLQSSECEYLRKLENETRMPKGFLALETLTLEATKL
jgi:predicted SAM-dependent methyltransferase